MINKIKKIVAKYPNRVAYQIQDSHITYQELWDLANIYGNFLKRQGTSPVVLYYPKSIHMVIAILASIIADRPYVPVECSTPFYRLKKIVTLTHASLILSDVSVCIDSVVCKTLDALKIYEGDKVKDTQNDLAYIIFTSGSTGSPKGVPISKANLINFVDWISHLEPLSSYQNICVLNQASFSFDLSVADFYYSLCNGHTLISFDGNFQNLDDLFLLLSKIHVAVMTPTFMKFCLLNQDFCAENYPNLQCVYFCGERLESVLVQKLFLAFPHIHVINAYGPTEATSAVSAIQITKEMATEDFLPVGEVKNFATDIEIMDHEIVLKGKSVSKGYLSGSFQSFYEENGISCYKTGDIGYIKDGKLYCKGRMDRQVKYKGYRIELDEVEGYFYYIEGVKDCAVIAKYADDFSLKMLKAFVVVQGNLDGDVIKRELAKYIPKYMIPKTIQIVQKLPVNANGKIDRKVLYKL